MGEPRASASAFTSREYQRSAPGSLARRKPPPGSARRSNPRHRNSAGRCSPSRLFKRAADRHEPPVDIDQAPVGNAQRGHHPIAAAKIADRPHQRRTGSDIASGGMDAEIFAVVSACPRAASSSGTATGDADALLNPRDQRFLPGEALQLPDTQRGEHQRQKQQQRHGEDRATPRVGSQPVRFWRHDTRLRQLSHVVNGHHVGVEVIHHPQRPGEHDNDEHYRKERAPSWSSPLRSGRSYAGNRSCGPRSAPSRTP